MAPPGTVGDATLLDLPALGLFCSRRCPGALVLRAYDLARTLRDAGVAVMGGFHSPMEQECLRLLLRGGQPVIVCPAREVAGYRYPAEWREAVEQRRLLLASPFGPGQERQTAALAAARNHFVVEHAGALFIAYADAGSQTERLAAHATATGLPVLTFDDPATANLVALGAEAVDPPTFDWSPWIADRPAAAGRPAEVLAGF